MVKKQNLLDHFYDKEGTVNEKKCDKTQINGKYVHSVDDFANLIFILSR
jgi:hypothetical protein